MHSCAAASFAAISSFVCCGTFFAAAGSLTGSQPQAEDPPVNQQTCLGSQCFHHLFGGFAGWENNFALADKRHLRYLGLRMKAVIVGNGIPVSVGMTLFLILMKT